MSLPEIRSAISDSFMTLFRGLLKFISVFFLDYTVHETSFLLTSWYLEQLEG